MGTLENKNPKVQYMMMGLIWIRDAILSSSVSHFTRKNVYTTNIVKLKDDNMNHNIQKLNLSSFCLHSAQWINRRTNSHK